MEVAKSYSWLRNATNNTSKSKVTAVLAHGVWWRTAKSYLQSSLNLAFSQKLAWPLSIKVVCQSHKIDLTVFYKTPVASFLIIKVSTTAIVGPIMGEPSNSCAYVTMPFLKQNYNNEFNFDHAVGRVVDELNRTRDLW